MCKPAKPLRITHIFDSSFKFNTALALSGDNPTFVSNGKACINCIFKQAMEAKLQDWTKNYGRWIINNQPNLSSRVPMNRFQLTRNVM